MKKLITPELTLLTTALVCCLGGCAEPIQPAHQAGGAIPRHEQVHSNTPGKAKAVMRNAVGEAVAWMSFTTKRDGTTAVALHADLGPDQAGFHGLHVHANDNPANGDGCLANPAEPPSTHFLSADGHFTVPGHPHGQHAADMPSPLVMENGTAELEFRTDHLQVSDVIGRAVILHYGPDNFGNIPIGTEPNQYQPNSPAATAATAATGNAGPRLACGVIELSDEPCPEMHGGHEGYESEAGL